MRYAEGITADTAQDKAVKDFLDEIGDPQTQLATRQHSFGRDGRSTRVLFAISGLQRPRGFNFPAHRNLRVREGVENLLR